MRNAIIIFSCLLFAGLASGQAPEKRFVGNCSFSGFTLLADSTYRGNITRFDDRMGNGYNLTQLAVGYEIFDGRGLVFEIDTIHTSTNFTADVSVTAKVNRGFEPFGSGQVYNPTASGMIPPSSQEQAGLSPTQKARIDIHNVVKMEALVGGRDSVYSITNVPDTTGLSPVTGDIFINTAKDTAGFYNGTGWVLFFRGLRSNGLTLDFVGRYDGANGLVNADIEDDGTTVTIGFLSASEVDILPADTTTIGGTVSRLGGQAGNRITVDDDTGETDIVAATGVDITAGVTPQAVRVDDFGVEIQVDGGSYYLAPGSPPVDGKNHVQAWFNGSAQWLNLTDSLAAGVTDNNGIFDVATTRTLDASSTVYRDSANGAFAIGSFPSFPNLAFNYTEKGLFIRPDGGTYPATGIFNTGSAFSAEEGALQGFTQSSSPSGSGETVEGTHLSFKQTVSSGGTVYGRGWNNAFTRSLDQSEIWGGGSFSYDSTKAVIGSGFLNPSSEGMGLYLSQNDFDVRTPFLSLSFTPTSINKGFNVLEKKGTAYFPHLTIDYGDTTANTIRLYRDKYRMPNAQPSVTLADTSVIGWVGNGTTTTPVFLDYAGGGGAGDNLGDHTATTNLNMDGNTILGGTGTTSDLILQTTSGVGTTGADMFFLVGNNGGTEAMKILNNGNVGIGGVTTPAQTLHVQGTARITGSDGTPTGIMGRDADGDVGAVSLGTGLTLTTGTLTANDTVTTLIQDSILVYSFAGVETGRDTLQLSLGGAGGAVTGSGASGQVALWNGTTSQTGSDYIKYETGSGSGALKIVSESTSFSNRGFVIEHYQDGLGTTGYVTKKARGTPSVPTVVAFGDLISANVVQGYTGTGYLTDNALWGAKVTGTPGASSVPISFYFCPGSAAGSYTSRLNIWHNGNVLIGNGGSITAGLTAPSYVLDINGTGGARIPVGTTAQQPTGADGVIRYNSTLTVFEGYGSSAWNSILTTQAATGKLTAGSVAFGASTGISEDNSNLFWNDTDNRLGIGTNAPDVSLDFTGKTDGVDLPAGTTAQRPTSDQGTIRFNTDLKTLEVASASTWFQTRLTGTDRALGDDTSANYGSADAGGIIQISDATNNSTIITYTLPATPEDKLEITCECKAGSVIDGDDGCRIAGNGNNIQGSANYDFAAANTTVTIRYSSVLGEWKIIY